MARRAAVTPNRHLHTTIPADLFIKLEQYLFSDVEGRVPQGAYQSFVSKQIWEFFNHRELDLSPYINGAMPGEFVIRGNAEALAALTILLQGETK